MYRFLMLSLLLASLLSGCADLGRKTLVLSGCEPTALDHGYCHMPKEVQP